MIRRAFFCALSFWVVIVDLNAGGRWVTLSNCRYLPNRANDGDSFHVAAGSKHYLFRLYFVDAPETDPTFPDRIDEQAKYFGITPDQTLKVGKLADEFTREKLIVAFTVRTCFQDALGASKMQRFYAIVQTSTGDLAEQLIENGLGRIHGASANPTGLSPARVEWQKLERLEQTARTEKVGGWGANYGRMYARSVSFKNRAPVDPFEAFFHPERAARKSGTQAAADEVTEKKTDPFDAFFHPKPTRETTAPDRETRKTRSTPIPTVVSSRGESAKLDLNKATEKQLIDLPGIGPALAKKIIAARPFKSADDLRKVKGIGEKRYAKIRPHFE